MEKGGLFWEGGGDSGRVVYGSGKRGYISWVGRVYYRCLKGRSIFWERQWYILGRIYVFKMGGGYILGRIYVFKMGGGGILWEEG